MKTAIVRGPVALSAWIARHWVIVLIIIVGIIPIIYFFTRWGEVTFLDSAMGNWFATMIGIILGLPIALLLSQWQQKAQAQADEAERTAERNARKTKILILLEAELEYNRQILELVMASEAKNSRVLSQLGMKNALWNAFTDGGEIHWISDLDLIDALANAYFTIEPIKYLESLYYLPDFDRFVMFTPEGENPYPTFAGEKVVNHVRELRPLALTAVKHALEVLRLHLSVLEPGRQQAPPNPTPPPPRP